MKRIGTHKFHAAVLSLLLLANVGCAKSLGLQLAGRNEYQASGSFTPGGVPLRTEWPRGENAQFFLGSWTGDRSNIGAFVSSSFTAPANIIVFLSGYPGLVANRLYLQDIHSNAQLPLMNAGIAGAAIGLALLSHGGIAFTVIALGIILLATRMFPPSLSAFSCILMLLLFLLPWRIYQKFYDPPGDRLLKWHLPGFRKLDSRLFSQLLTEAYTKPGTRVIIQNKIENMRTLLGPSPWLILRSGLNRASWANFLS